MDIDYNLIASVAAGVVAAKVIIDIFSNASRLAFGNPNRAIGHQAMTASNNQEKNIL